MIGPPPERPSHSAFQVEAVSLPTGVTSPMPVTTTRLVIWLLPLSKSVRAPPQGQRRPVIRLSGHWRLWRAVAYGYCIKLLQAFGGFRISTFNPEFLTMFREEVGIGLAAQECLVFQQL